MALENLFAVEPELPNTQKTKLPENPEKWAEMLTTHMREHFPDIAKFPLSVEFKKRDDQSGTAIGAVHVVSIEANKSVYVPFVIEKFEMHPLDIWMEKQTQAVHPLTKDTFKEQFFVQSFAENLDARPADSMGNYFNDPSMWTTNYPPLQGRYSYASAGYGVIDQISDTMTAEDLANFKAELTRSPMLLKKFAKHGHEDLIKKLAEKKSTVMTNDFGASASKLIPTSVVSVKKEGHNKYTILSASEGLFDLATSMVMNRHDCEKKLSDIVGKPQDFLNEVDQNGEKMSILKPAPTTGVWLYDKQVKGPVDANEFNSYWVKNKNGLMIDAIVIPDVVNFEGKRVKGRMVISDTHSSFQDSVAGVLSDSHTLDAKLRPQNVRVGQTGVFIHLGENGKAISTVPVTVKAIENHDKIHVVDLNGKAFTVRMGWGPEFKKSVNENDLKAVPCTGPEKTTVTLESLGFAEVKKDYFVIPEKMSWIPVEPMTEVMSSPGAWLEKMANENADRDPVEMLYTGIVYEITGHGLPKLAYNEREAKVLLAQLGADQVKTARAMEKAKRLGRATLHKCASLRPMSEVVANVKVTHEKVAAACALLKRNLVKEASEIEDKATVDVILSLNFLNPDNLAKFVSYVPLFEACADKLAELTLASRLGLKQVNVAAATGSMGKILEVLEGLKKIEGSMKKPTSKAV